MATSKKLANHTYPGLQELYFRLWKWTDTNFSLITLDHQLSLLSKYKRKELNRRSFQSLVSILEQMLAMDDTSSGLSADGRITLRTALGNPQHFAAVILQHFYELQLLLQLFAQNNTWTMPTVITGPFSQIRHNTLVCSLDGLKFGTKKGRFARWCVVSWMKDSGGELSFIE